MNDDPAARGVVMTPANINRFKRIELIESVTASDDISKEKSDRPKPITELFLNYFAAATSPQILPAMFIGTTAITGRR